MLLMAPDVDLDSCAEASVPDRIITSVGNYAMEQVQQINLYYSIRDCNPI